MQQHLWEERERKRERERRESKSIKAREKVERNTVFRCFAVPEGRNAGSLKRRVRSHLAGWAIKNCTRLWRGQNATTPQRGSTFGSWAVEKVHAAVARSAFPSQNVKALHPRALWEVVLLKSARRCGAKHVRFPSQNVQSTPFSDRFWTLNRHFSWQAQWVRHLHKSEPNVRALQQFKNDGRCGTFEDGLQLCMSRGRRSTRDISIRHVRRPGRGFPDTLEHQIAGFTKIIYPHLVMQIFFLGAHYYQS